MKTVIESEEFGALFPNYERCNCPFTGVTIEIECENFKISKQVDIKFETNGLGIIDVYRWNDSGHSTFYKDGEQITLKDFEPDYDRLDKELYKLEREAVHRTVDEIIKFYRNLRSKKEGALHG